MAQTPVAGTACANLPEAVKSYLKSETSWSIVDLKDLDHEDRDLWNKHGVRCPGMAAVRLDESGRLSYAVALLRRRDEKMLEKVVVLRPAGNAGMRAVTMVPPDIYGPVHVISLARPGSYKDFNTGRQVKTRHDGVNFENISASVELFYLAGEKFRSILITD